MHPANEIEVEFEEVDELEILTDQLVKQKTVLTYKIWQLKTLAQIEQDFKTFGSLTREQELMKTEILNQYI
jgi:hypothetical protein